MLVQRQSNQLFSLSTRATLPQSTCLREKLVIWVAMNTVFDRLRNTLWGFVFFWLKNLTEGMAKKVQLQGKISRFEDLMTTLSITFRLLLKDSPSFYEYNETTITSKKYDQCRQHNYFARFLKQTNSFTSY